MDLGFSNIISGSVNNAINGTLTTAKDQSIIDSVKKLNAATQNTISELNSSDSAERTKKIKAGLEKFEALLITQMLNFMYDTVEVDENFGGGFAEEMTRSFLTDEFGNIMSKSGGLGISDMIQKQMLQNQTI